MFLKVSLRPFYVWYSYVMSSSVGFGLVICHILLLVFVAFGLDRSTDLILYPVQGPSRILACCKDFL